MATGQGILERLRKSKEQVAPDVIPDALPMRAYYGREPEAEEMRSRMYAAVERAMAFDPHEVSHYSANAARYTLIDLKETIAVLNSSSSPVEYLVSRGDLETKADEDGMGGARFHTALRFRDLMDGSQVKMLKSPSLEGGGGGGGASAGDIRSYQLDCMSIVEMLRHSLGPAWVFPLMEAVVWKDDWMDFYIRKMTASRREAKLKERMKSLLGLHFALDRAGLALGYLPEGEVTARWPEPPKMPPVIRRRILASTAVNRLSLQT